MASPSSPHVVDTPAIQRVLRLLRFPPKDVVEASKAIPVLEFMFAELAQKVISCSSPSALNDLNAEKGIYEQMGCHFDELQTDGDGRVVEVRAGQEVVALDHPVSTQGVPLVSWLQHVLLAVPRTLKQLFTAVVASEEPISGLAAKLPTTTLVLLSQVRFTRIVELAIRSAADSTHVCSGSNNIRLIDMVEPSVNELVQQLSNAINDPTRRSECNLNVLEMLMVIAVGQKNCLRQLLQHSHDDGQLTTYWKSCIRHYHVPGNGNPVEALVRTTVTDLVYQEIFKALSSDGVLLLTGPPGAGKTEMVRELAEVELGYWAVISNFTKGMLAIEGLTECFHKCIRTHSVFWVMDNIHIEDQKQMVGFMIKCKAERKSSYATRSAPQDLQTGVVLHADEAPLLPIVFATHPGYSGLSEVGSFPLVEIGTPDVSSILQVQLAAHGFSQHDELARRAAAIIHWCRSSLIQNACWYDFGLRIVKSLVRASMQYLRQGMSEVESLVRGLRASVTPQLSPKDTNEMVVQLQQAFPESKTSGMELLGELPATVQQLLQNSSSQGESLEKLSGLVLATQQWSGLAVMTSNTQRSLNTLSMCAHHIGRQLVYLGHQMIPSADRYEYLYGKTAADGSWREGIFAAALKRAVASDVHTWIVLDGPTDAVLMEPLQTLFDDLRQLWLWNGESIALTDNVRIIFLLDVAAISQMAPSTLTRVGKVSFTQQPSDSKLQLLPGTKRKALTHGITEASCKRLTTSAAPDKTQGANASIAECSDSVADPSMSIGDLSWLFDETSNQAASASDAQSSVLQKCSAESWVKGSATEQDESATTNHNLMDIRVQQIAAEPCMTSPPCTTATPSLDAYLNIDAEPKAQHAHAMFSVGPTQAAEPVPEGQPDPYIGKQVILLVGKNRGKSAIVEKRINEKYRLHTHGVPKAFEYFPKQFALLPTIYQP